MEIIRPDETTRKLDNTKYVLVGFAVVAGGVYFFVGSLFYGLVVLPKCSSDLSPMLGQFGDFVGGLTNPVISVLGLAALALTMKLQRAQLQLAAQEVRDSNRRATKELVEMQFLRLLEVLGDSADRVSIRKNASTLNGEAVLEELQLECNLIESGDQAKAKKVRDFYVPALSSMEYVYVAIQRLAAESTDEEFHISLAIATLLPNAKFAVAWLLSREVVQTDLNRKHIAMLQRGLNEEQCGALAKFRSAISVEYKGS